MNHKTLIAFAFALPLALAGCGDDSTSSGTAENGRTSEPPLQQPSEATAPEISLVNIAPGGAEPIDQQSPAAEKYKDDPQAIATGRQMFISFNCVGCHSHGSGGMGPALMDDKWIYGGSMENIASSIREGRPAGMPAFREMVQGDTVYMLAAYVRSLSQPSNVKMTKQEVIAEAKKDFTSKMEKEPNP